MYLGQRGSTAESDVPSFSLPGDSFIKEQIGSATNTTQYDFFNDVFWNNELNTGGVWICVSER